MECCWLCTVGVVAAMVLLGAHSLRSAHSSSLRSAKPILDLDKAERERYPLPRNFRTARVDGQTRRSESKHGAAEGASPTRATTARLPVGGARRDSNAGSRRYRGHVFATGERGNRQ
eukprot:COSAG06_NODE_1682_length_8731_cov_5.569045_4_plen_117_part_00